MAGIEESFEDCGGMLQSDDIRTGFIYGAIFRNKPVQYSVVDDLAVFEGCIVLGRADEMDEIAQNVQSNQAGEDAGVDVPRERDIAVRVHISLDGQEDVVLDDLVSTAHIPATADRQIEAPVRTV